MIRMAYMFSVISVLFLCVIPSLAQQPDTSNGYFVQHYTDENGLPQNSINDLLFDDDGYLWLGSQVGLICFSGYSFKLFYPNDKPVMESNVLRLGKGGKGQIYFQTDDQSLYCYPRNNSHRLSPVNTAATRGPRLLNTRKQLFDFTHFLNDVPRGAPADRDRRQQIFEDLFEHSSHFYALDSVRTYLVYRDTLYYYDGSALLSLCEAGGTSLLLSGRQLYLLKKGAVAAVYEGGKKTAGASEIKGDAIAGSYRLFSSGNTAHLLAGHRLYRLLPDGAGGLSSRFLLDLSFAANISAVEYNPALDLLLVATTTDGFYYLRKSPFQSDGFPPGLKKQLRDHPFGPLALYRGTEILTNHFRFSASGASRMTKDSSRVWHRCLYISRKEEIWGAVWGTPQRMTGEMALIKEYPPLDAYVADYKEDEKGNLYCLTQGDLWRLQGDSFRLVLSKNQLPLKGVNELLCPIGPHRWWIGNVGGLMEYDPDSGTLRTVSELSGAHVRSIHVCRDGSILVGTYGQGYFYYRRGQFFHMPLDKNEFLITAHCFLEDRKDNIWIPCNKGLFKIPKADIDAWADSAAGSQLYYYYYGRQDGLLTNEFNGGFNASGVLTGDGFAALLSMKGMVCFQTDSLRSDFPRGRVDLAGIEIDGKAGLKTDTIELMPDYNSLLVTLSCPFLGSRNNLYMEYNVRGLDRLWKPVPEDGVLNLSRLSPGDYTLRVRKVEGFGKNNYSYREWVVTVIPHFYQTVWFILLVMLFFLVLLASLLQLWLKLKEKRKEVWVKAEESRQALLQSGNLREKLISLVIHDLRSPLRFLTLLASDMYDNQANYTAEEVKERIYWIKKGSQDVYHFSEDFLLWVTSQKDNFNISRRQIHLRPLLQEICDFFQEQVQQKGNRLSYQAEESLSTWSDPHLLITIIRNLVDNANKYTDGGFIVLSACEKGDRLLISVSDTGRGMSPRQVEFFMQEVSLENVRSGSQLGHKFVFDLTQRLDGNVAIESKEGKGTTVTLSFPLEESKKPG